MYDDIGLVTVVYRNMAIYLFTGNTGKFLLQTLKQAVPMISDTRLSPYQVAAIIFDKMLETHKDKSSFAIAPTRAWGAWREIVVDVEHMNITVYNFDEEEHYRWSGDYERYLRVNWRK